MSKGFQNQSGRSWRGSWRDLARRVCVRSGLTAGPGRRGHVACKHSALRGLLSLSFSLLFATLYIVISLLFFLADLKHEPLLYVTGNIYAAGD